MEKEISFKDGLRLSPYGDVSPDGQMSICDGLELQGGVLRPSLLAGRSFSIGTGDATLVHVHATGEYEHLVFYVEEGGVHNLKWCSESDASDRDGRLCVDLLPLSTVDIGDAVKSVSSVGNVLTVSTSDDTLYAIWRDGGYTWLGPVPELSVRWSLRGRYEPCSVESLDVEPWNNHTEPDVKYNRQAAAVTAYVEKYCNAEGGRFVHPFLVRAAYRLYDGKTWTKHTPPVLMSPNVNGPVLGYLMEGHTIPSVEVLAFCSALEYQLTSTIPEEWNGLIQGVDIFVSLPLDPWEYTYDEERHRDQQGRGSRGPEYLIDFSSDSLVLNSAVNDQYGEYDAASHCIHATGQISYYVHLDYKTDKELEAHGETSNFYLLKSLSFKESRSSAAATITLEKNQYANLMFQERLSDDLDSHDRIGAEISMSYNRRLNQGSLLRKVFAGHTIRECLNHLTQYYQGDAIYHCYWVRRNGSQEVYADAGTLGGAHAPMVNHMRYVYTPDPSVVALVVVLDFSGYDTVRVELTRHPFLNGRYAYDRDGIIKDGDWSSATGLPVPEELIREERNIVRTSEKDNPFVFQAAGLNQLGNGRLLALSTVTKPLSEGQFGQFPLMALCSDGNYALSVISSGELAGLYDGISAMKRDVCVNPGSVTQTDSAILFVSNRGVMLADGNDIQCISEGLHGPVETALDATRDVLSEEGVSDIRDFFRESRCIWDYSGQRAIFFRRGEILLVFQLQTGTWHTMHAGSDPIAAVQNVYPYSYIQTEGGELTILDKDADFDSDTLHEGYLETRPIKMDTMQLKKLNEFALQGHFGERQTIALWGSNDERTWHLLGTTTNRRVPHVAGRWFKYWRFSVLASLKRSEHISGLRIRYDVRSETRLR